jgi:hydrogenase maturation protease
VKSLNSISPVLVAACGNAWAGDDAFGPLVARALRRRNPSGLEVVEVGMKPAGLLDHLQHRAALIVVDAAEPRAEDRAGRLIDVDFRSPNRPGLRHDVALSSHGLSIAHELALAQVLDMLPPRVRLIATAAHVTQMGQAPSPGVLRAVPRAVNRILDLSRRWIECTNLGANRSHA